MLGCILIRTDRCVSIRTQKNRLKKAYISRVAIRGETPKKIFYLVSSVHCVQAIEFSDMAFLELLRQVCVWYSLIEYNETLGDEKEAIWSLLFPWHGRGYQPFYLGQFTGNED